MIYALTLFLLTAMGGGYLAYAHVGGKSPPLGVAVAHGAGGLLGSVVLAWLVFRNEAGIKGIIALPAFGVAAILGAFLFTAHYRSRGLPTPMIVIHGLAALLGIALVISATLEVAGP